MLLGHKPGFPLGRLAAVALVCAPLLACFPADPLPPPVPAIPAERIPSPPASTVTLIWQPGHYDWTGAAYRWVPGEWVDRSGHGPLWQDGAWQRDASGRWAWVAAHWL